MMNRWAMRMLRSAGALSGGVSSALRRTMASSVRPAVVVTRRMPPDRAQEVMDRIRDNCALRFYWDSDTPVDRRELIAKCRGADGIFCLLTDRIDAEVLDAAGKSLKVVSTMSVGFDHVDVAACRERRVAVGNTPGVLTETTADTAVMLMLMAARKATLGVDAVRHGMWPPWQPFWLNGIDLHGATVGVVGLGRIGEAVANRVADGFRCTVLYSSASPDPMDRISAGGAVIRGVSLSTLLSESDFVSVHAPLTPATRHMFNRTAFAQMKRSSVFVNTSRGDVVDQDDLVEALRSGQIGAAGIDVTTPEPLPPTHPLLQLPNCVVLPHIGSASKATRLRMAHMAVDNLVAGVLGKPLPNSVK